MSNKNNHDDVTIGQKIAIVLMFLGSVGFMYYAAIVTG